MEEQGQLVDVLAKNITRLMKIRKIGGVQLASLSGVPQSTISRISNGKVNISLELAVKIAKGLQVNLSDLLVGSGVSGNPVVSTALPKDLLSVGILSIKNKRIICVKAPSGETLNQSELPNGLDLADNNSHLFATIQEAIFSVVSNIKSVDQFQNISLKLVMQSYEFTAARAKFIHFISRFFHDVLLLPDWKITHLAAFNDQPGIALTVDKGVSLSYMDDKILKKLGGWKFPVYDLGGANWLGQKAIQHTIEAKEGYIPMTSLARNILLSYDNKIEGITEACFKNNDTDIYSSFAEPLLMQYLKQDATAKKIINEGYAHIQKGIDHIDKLMNEKFMISINGSLSGTYKPMLDKDRLCPPITSLEKANLLAQLSGDLF